MESYVLIGNSRIKIYAHKNLEEPIVFEHKSILDVKYLLKNSTAIYVASVVPKLSIFLSDNIGLNVKIIENKNLSGIINATDIPDNTGIDRLLNVLALHNNKTNNIIIDCGTALSISVINHEGTFLGGTISSGLSTESAALKDNTAKLELINDFKNINKTIAKNTVDAINNGILIGKIGAIKEIILGIKKELKNNYPTNITLTGGWAYLIKGHLPYNYDTNLTIKGLLKVVQSL
jgi:type III pantothenate kinase